jgi:hypothetical protein
MRGFKLLLIGILAAAVGIAVLTSAGCQKKASEEVDPGTIENSVYHNNYFAMSITIPGNWSVLNKQQREMLTNMGKQMVNRNAKKAIDAAEDQMVNLLTAYKHPLGTPVPFNPGFMCIAERIRHLPGVKRGRDYHYHSRKLLQTSGIDVKIADEVSTLNLGGIEFDVMSYEMNMMNTVIYQKAYATVLKGYALVFNLVFSTPEEERLLEDILDTLKFD